MKQILRLLPLWFYFSVNLVFILQKFKNVVEFCEVLCVVVYFCICSHLAAVQSTGSPGRRALPSQAPADDMGSAALSPESSQSRHSDGRDEVWSYIYQDLTEDRHVAFLVWKFTELKKLSWVEWNKISTVCHLAACSRMLFCPSLPVPSRSLQALNLPLPPAPSQGCFCWDPTLVDT